LPPVVGKFRCEKHERKAQAARKKSSKSAFRKFAMSIGLTNLYAIRCGDAIKFGIAIDVAARLISHQVSSPYKVELVAFCPALKRHEKEVHAELAAHRIQGEWFRDCPEVQAMIDRIKSKSFAPRDYVALQIANIKAGGKIRRL
jgi:hypothetical protein